jgi:hypothetical protein
MGFWSRIVNIFRRPAAQSGGSVIVTGGASGGGKTGSYSTNLNVNDPTMMRQLEQAERYKSIIHECANNSNLPVAIICGIGSRESHWGLALKPPHPGGTGDFSQRRPRGTRTGMEPPDGGGYGRGLMQIDYDWHEFARTGAWQDPRQNLLYAAKVLNSADRFFRNKGMPEQYIERAVIAAYNAGATATWNCYQGGEDLDCNTTGRDYSEDVMNRAGWFQLHGW